VVLTVLKDHQPYLAEAERNYSKCQTRHKVEQEFEQMLQSSSRGKVVILGGDSFGHCGKNNLI
jgi:nicotinamide riboside kinase